MATTTSLLAGLASDLLAIALLAYVVYFRRYHRRDLLLAYVALNVGVLAVTTMLTGTQAGIGLGLGLFGILSIIRLRSDQITQEEVAYYFVALALGLVNGLRPARAGWPRPGSWAALEIERRRRFAYESVYFDTPDLLTYRQHLQGRRRRYKVRTRAYLDSGDCAFEVKLKGRRDQTVKARLPYPVAARAHLTVDAREFLADQLLTAYGQPAPRLAATGLTRHVLVESKSPGPAAGADTALRRLGLRPVQLSKYCVAVALLHPAPARQPLAPHPTPLLPPAGQPLVPVVGWRWRARAPTPHSDTSAHAPSRRRKPHCRSRNARTARRAEPMRLSSR